MKLWLPRPGLKFPQAEVFTTQSEILKLTTRHGCNVGFGAKKNFTTYDPIYKVSDWISFTSLVVGVFALFIPELVTDVISAILIIFDVTTMYIQFYDSEKQSYESAGIEQTKIFNELEVIYRSIKSDVNFDYQHTRRSIDAVMSRFYGTITSKQVFGNNWCAHYKFYCESEKAWVKEELSLTLKDKIPLSLCFFASLTIIFAIAIIWKAP